MSVLKIAQDRLKLLSDLSSITAFFFEEPKIDLSFIENDKQLSKLPKAQLAGILHQAIAEFKKIEDFNADNIQTSLNHLLESLGQKPIILFSIIRLATSWAAYSPELPASLEILGKDKTIERLANSASYLEK
jgi:glutamyl/glutaminyl-tRNA synthetase